MSILDNNLAIPKGLTDYVDARDKMISARDSAERILEAAKQVGDEIGSYIWPYEERMKMSRDKFIKELDNRLWKQAFDKTGFMQLLDNEAKKKLEVDIRDNTPEFSIANIKTTFLSLAQDADMMFKRGVVNVFLRLDNAYKTNSNEPFKVGEKIIMSYAFRRSYAHSGLAVSDYSEGKFNDLDRVLKVLDGKQHNPRELQNLINMAMGSGMVYEDEYVKVKGFKNGNGHLTFKRLDLLDKINELISEYYNGNALAGRKAA